MIVSKVLCCISKYIALTQWYKKYKSTKHFVTVSLAFKIQNDKLAPLKSKYLFETGGELVTGCLKCMDPFLEKNSVILKLIAANMSKRFFLQAGWDVLAAASWWSMPYGLRVH